MAITNWHIRMMACIKHLISKTVVASAGSGLWVSLVIATALIAFAAGDARSEQDQLAVYSAFSVSNDPAYDSLALVDFSFTLSRKQLEFFRPDSLSEELYGRIFAQVTIYGVDGLPTDSVNTYFSARVSSPEEITQSDFTLFNRLSVMLSPGIYTARLIVIDVVSKRQGDVFFDEIVIEPSLPDRLVIGGETMAYLISRAEEEETADRMIRNGFRVLVNPLGAYTTDDTVCYLYSELYGMTYSDQVPSEYRLAYAVFDNLGAVYRDFGYKVRTKAGTSAVVVEQFDISGWATGRYRIRLIACDLAADCCDTTFFPLHIIPKLRPGFTFRKSIATDPYDTLSAEVREHLVAYILSPVQKQTLSQLSADGKEVFLDEYWYENDSYPETRVIENRLDMIERYEFSNQYFSSNLHKTNGWSSDRGRIYMTYGPYEEKDDVSAPVRGNPIIVWLYHSLDQGTVFVFEDRQGFHDYTLVHSTIEGERFSKEWDSRLQGDQYKLDWTTD